MKNNRNKKTIYKTMLDGRHYTPGTVTMHKGQVISGSNGIAGLVGFKPFDVDVAEIPGMMAEGKCFDIMAKTIGSIIAFLNPNEIVVTGYLLNCNMVADLIIRCYISVMIMHRSSR